MGKIAHIISIEWDTKENQPAVEAASRAFVSSDQDGIDRILLDE